MGTGCSFPAACCRIRARISWSFHVGILASSLRLTLSYDMRVERVRNCLLPSYETEQVRVVCFAESESRANLARDNWKKPTALLNGVRAPAAVLPVRVDSEQKGQRQLALGT